MSSTLIAATRGAKNILQKHLGLSALQNLLIIFEEETGAVARVFDEVASELGILTTLVYVRRDLQSQYLPTTNLPHPFSAAAQQSQAMLTCLNDSAECMIFRDKLLQLRDSELAIGHAPGISINMLSNYFDVNVSLITERCNMLALPLAMGERLTLKTYTIDGREFELSTSIGGWDRLPVISDGTVPRGAWGNLLPGETYIAPQEGLASGTIVINGSIARKVLKDTELILTFEQGRLVRADCDNIEVLNHFYTTSRDVALAKNDSNWNMLAEIGIGTNEAIKNLTGIPAIDEKSYGTAHIAIGDNIGMGGNNESAIHYDMIVCFPTIIIDGKLLMVKGEVEWHQNEWQEVSEDINVTKSWLRNTRYIRRSPVRLDNSVEHLRKISTNGAQKEMYFDIGMGELAQIAKRILNIIPPTTIFDLNIPDLSEELDVSEELIVGALGLLHRHTLITFVK